MQHAIAVLKEYWNIHIDYSEKQNEHEFWESLESFINGFPDIPASCHRTITKNEFYRQKEASFPQFAWARHTLRYYSSIPLSETQIKAAIDLARSTPSACNRQHCRVHCVSDKKQIQALLDIQAGNRGFGHLADKLLVITSDLEVNLEERERNDVYVNGGMFLMNLCYALYYYEIAHCILNWSRTPAEDQAVREIIRLKPSETVIAVLSCGNTPDEFMVASSPRKSLEEYYVKE